jgi:hypothetical protein
MPNDKAREAAKHILEDRHEADYYQDTQLLSGYLEGTLGLTKEDAEKIAKAIQEDRTGANYYEDAEILSDFLRR